MSSPKPAESRLSTRRRRILPRKKSSRKAERARVVWNAVRALPAEYRVPLVLHHYDGMSYKDIAETMGLSLSAVETRIHRAKKKLIPKLEPWLDRI